MTETIRYLSVALQTIRLLQTQLIKYLQKASSLPLLQFKKTFQHHLNKVKTIELQKSIESDKISSCLIEMDSFLQKTLRIRKNSHSERFNQRANLIARQTDRMQLSGRKFYQSHISYFNEKELSDIQQITQSYKIQQSHRLSSRMKWRISPYENSPQISRQQNKNDILGSSSIQLLNQTIPEMQNRIKMLTTNRNSLQRTKQPYRTLQTRNHQQRRYIRRLF